MSKQTTSKTQSAIVLWLKMHIYMMLASIILLGVASSYVYFYILTPKYEVGELHVKDIIPAKDLKSWQSDLDVLINLQDDENHYYTSLLTTTMTAGINMDDVNVQEDGDTIHITIPQAKRLSLESNREKAIREDTMDSHTISAAKVFASDYAIHILENEHSLHVAQKEAVRLLGDFAQVVGNKKNKKINIQTESMPDKNAPMVELKSTRSGIYVQHFPLKNKWKSKVYTPEDGKYVLYEWASQGTKVQLYTVGLLQGNDVPLAPFRCDSSDGIWAKQFNPLNENLSFGMSVSPKSNRATFCWQADGQVYKMEFVANDEHAYQQKLPDAMMLAYGIRYNTDFLFDKDTNYALGGISKEVWSALPSHKRVSYFLDALKYGSSFNMTLAEHDKGAAVYANESEGSDSINAETMQNLWKHIPLSERSNVRVVLYDYNRVHRDRLIALSPQKIYFFVPSRKLHGLQIPMQDAVYESIDIEKLAATSNNENHEIHRTEDGGWEVDGKVFDSVQFGKFMKAIIDHKMFDMISLHS